MAWCSVAGVITEMTVKAHKIPQYSTAVRVAFDSIDAAAKTVQDTLAVRSFEGFTLSVVLPQHSRHSPRSLREGHTVSRR